MKSIEYVNKSTSFDEFHQASVYGHIQTREWHTKTHKSKWMHWSVVAKLRNCVDMWWNDLICLRFETYILSVRVCVKLILTFRDRICRNECFACARYCWKYILYSDKNDRCIFYLDEIDSHMRQTLIEQCKNKSSTTTNRKLNRNT